GLQEALEDRRGTTDVGPSSPLIGTRSGGNAVTYAGAHGGLLFGRKTIENTVSSASAALAAEGIMPVSSSLFLDVDGLLGTLDPGFRFFSHDKVEGVAALQNGNQIVLGNDSDFGISGVASTTPPFLLQAWASWPPRRPRTPSRARRP